MDNLQIDSFEVQSFLDSLTATEAFRVRFIKQDGSVSEYTGCLGGSDVRKQSVAIMTDNGWKRFSVGRVIEIERV